MVLVSECVGGFIERDMRRGESSLCGAGDASARWASTRARGLPRARALTHTHTARPRARAAGT